MLSVIIPAYNEESMIPETVRTLSAVLGDARIPHELIFVDDGSSDATWREICGAAERQPAVRGVHFSRNFGKEAAMFAGLAAVRGECAVVIDCDLQHPPEKITEMYRLWEQGFEVVEGVKSSRGSESGAHRGAARLFYKLMSGSTGFDMQDSSDFKLLDRKVVDTLNSLTERGVFFRALSFWTGFKRTEVSYEVRERTAGESKWSTWKLIRYATNNITSFSSAPLHLITVLGMVMLAVSVIFGLTTLIQRIAGAALGGFTTVILLLLFTGSLIMISLGVIGFYLGKIYDEIKGRPRYIISETCGTAEEPGEKE